MVNDMQVSYKIDLIKQILISDYFQTYRDIAESDCMVSPSDFSFVKVEHIGLFIEFLQNLIYLEKESRLDYIKEISLPVEHVDFMTEIILSSEIENY